MHEKRLRRVTNYLTKDEDVSKIRFDVHHRRPQCRGGKDTVENCVEVDRPSHEAFNALVQLASKHCGIEVWKVEACHIAKALNVITTIQERLLVDPQTGKLKEPRVVVSEFNDVWLPMRDPIRHQS